MMTKKARSIDPSPATAADTSGRGVAAAGTHRRRRVAARIPEGDAVNLGEERERLRIISTQPTAFHAAHELGIKEGAVRDWLKSGDRLKRCAILAKRNQEQAQKAVFAEMQTADVARMRTLESKCMAAWVLRYWERRKGTDELP
jgi:hypothetical protein